MKTVLDMLAWRINALVWSRYLRTCYHGRYLVLDHDECRAIAELLKGPRVIPAPGEFPDVVIIVCGACRGLGETRPDPAKPPPEPKPSPPPEDDYWCIF